jgi:protein-S-isoprenylcysteine O-methyltransferase Ste14
VGDGRSHAVMTTFVRGLARRRVHLGFASAVLVLWLAQPTHRSLFWGSLVALGGEGLRLWAAGHLTKSRDVTMSGPYRWTAHPLYAGSLIMGAGLAIAAASVVATVVIAIYLGATIVAAIRSEEAFLRERFGDRYDDYRRGAVLRGSTRRFSLKQAIANREYRALAGLVGAMLLLALKATYNDVFWRAGAGH